MTKKRSFVFYLLVFCLIISVCFHSTNRHRKNIKRHFHKETALKLVSKKKFFTKIHSTPPVWMTEQIAEDFKEFTELGISKKQVDRTFAQIRKVLPHPFIVRYRVIEKQLYRYFPENEPITLQDNSTEKALKALIHCGKFRNLDFIFSYLDGMPITGMPSNYHVTEDKLNQAPVLFSAKAKDIPYVVLIPDWRSTSKWWSSNIKNIRLISQNLSWDEKKNHALWRGSLTKQIRLKLCQIASEHPEYLNAKINVKVDDQELQNDLEKQGLFGERVSWNEFLTYKYLPTVDGVCCAAPALQWRLFSHSVALKQESEEIQWFYRALVPYSHYIPVKNDLSDLIEKIQWAKTHDSLCKEMADRAFEFTRDNLMMEDVFLYFYLVLKQYESIQTIDAKQLKKETKSNPRWVNIQYRNELRKRAKNDRLNHYLDSSSPFPH